MEFHFFGLLLYIIISVHGNDNCTFGGHRCFIGGYQYFPNIGYYKLYTVSLSWSDAWKQCKDDGAHLVVINSKDEYEIIREMQKFTKQHIAIGIHDHFKEGVFLTVTGEDFIPNEYLKWNKGEPNNRGNQSCVVMFNSGVLDDILCSKSNYFICEHNQDPSYPLIPK